MTEKELGCCFTGYRPNKLPFPTDKSSPAYIQFENQLQGEIFRLIENGCTCFYTGMAMGFDIIAAECVLLAKDTYKKSPIKLICALPFIEQDDSFKDLWRERYNDILARADEVILISDKYYSGCYQKRNKFMVKNSDFVLTWFDGKRGGTKNTIDYAKSLGRTVINLFEEQEKENCYTEYQIF